MHWGEFHRWHSAEPVGLLAMHLQGFGYYRARAAMTLAPIKDGKKSA
jgi:hypothetical protein